MQGNSNLHISMTNFSHESRVLKETASILKFGIASKVYIAALRDGGQAEFEVVGENIEARRFDLISRRLKKNLIMQGIKYIEFCLRVASYYSDKNIKIVNVHTLALLPLGFMLKALYRSYLVYDAHELETETEGLHGLRKRLSKLIERLLIKRCDQVIVVSNNIADWYQSEYGIERPTVILNAPKLHRLAQGDIFRAKFKIPQQATIFLYQGAFVNGRGVRLLIEAFSHLRGGLSVLIFMGYGPLENEVRSAADRDERIFYHPPVQPHDVPLFTSSADIGISIIENICLSYYYCMPNKLFEYAMCGLPVLASSMKEMSEVVSKYDMGWVLDDHIPKSLASAIDSIAAAENVAGKKARARKCAEDHCWENQEKLLVRSYQRMLGT